MIRNKDKIKTGIIAAGMKEEFEIPGEGTKIRDHKSNSVSFAGHFQGLICGCNIDFWLRY